MKKSIKVLAGLTCAAALSATAFAQANNDTSNVGLWAQALSAGVGVVSNFPSDLHNANFQSVNFKMVQGTRRLQAITVTFSSSVASAALSDSFLGSVLKVVNARAKTKCVYLANAQKYRAVMACKVPGTSGDAHQTMYALSTEGRQLKIEALPVSAAQLLAKSNQSSLKDIRWS